MSSSRAAAPSPSPTPTSRPGETAAASTPVFAPPDVGNMRTYELMATPLVNPGQVDHRPGRRARPNTGAVDGSRSGCGSTAATTRLHDRDGEPVTLAPGAEHTLTLTVPPLGGQPLGEVGIAIASASGRADGAVLLDYLRWDGAPEVELRKPAGWRHVLAPRLGQWRVHRRAFGPNSFRINQSRGEGLYAYGTREWTDYTVAAPLAVNLGDGGLALRVQGMRRYYAVRLCRRGALEIARVRDGEDTVTAWPGSGSRSGSPIAAFSARLAAASSVASTRRW